MRDRALHNLKTLPEYFVEIWDGVKKFELRKNDRNYKIGDYLKLNEYEPEADSYSGSYVLAEIDYILDQCEHFGLKDGYAIMSFRVIEKYEEDRDDG